MAETNENDDIFYDDWVACLSAHYLYTLATGETANALGLRRVLLEAGVTETFIDGLGSGVLPTEGDVNEMPESADYVEAGPASDAQPVSVPVAESGAHSEPMMFDPIPPEAPRAEPYAAPPLFETIGFELPVMDTAAEPAPSPDLIPDYPNTAKTKKNAKKPAPPQPTLF